MTPQEHSLKLVKTFAVVCGLTIEQAIQVSKLHCLLIIDAAWMPGYPSQQEANEFYKFYDETINKLKKT